MCPSRTMNSADSPKKESDVHVPVMVETVQELLRASQGGTFFDGTIGMGGHGAAILGANPSNVLWGNDKDGEALEICREKLPADRTTLLRGDFRQILSHQVEIFDGFLFDLGVSSFQLDRPEKGFSYSRPAPLDMRMDDRLELTAAGVVNTYGYEELMRVFRDYGEFGRPDRLVKELMMARRRTPFQSTDQLKEFVRSLYPRQKTMDPLARVFQALRIEVNGELDGLEEFLLNLIERMKRGARIVVISFHSLEDRIVKNSLKAASEKKLLTLLTKKPLTAASEEVEGNPRSRSAKVRAGERT
ncbi:MAG: Ribosomal RNA small subunit methyltransferase H [Candidatus Aminicenantes bacterium ADurb.Bin508]|nr:MAG: Ribosomal RNA small subunit methyltransferase H [Candidatus Aminicenantes bacterium ADurb.Bin508]